MKIEYINNLIKETNQYIPNDLTEGTYRWKVFIYSNLFDKLNRNLTSYELTSILSLVEDIKSHHIINWVRNKLYEIHPNAINSYIKYISMKVLDKDMSFKVFKVLLYLNRMAIDEKEYIIDDYMLEVIPDIKKYIKEEYKEEPIENKYEFDISTKYEFWNQNHWDNFAIIRDMYVGKNDLSFMEIGVCEGWTTTKLLDDILTGENCKIYCIDPNPTTLFYKNIKTHMSKVHIEESLSIEVLPRMIVDNKLFDFIYIDGDHNAKGILEDMVLSWRLLKIGGVLLVDDYEMKIKDLWFYKCHKEFKDTPRLLFVHPMVAISSFLTIYKGCYELIINNYQIGLKKLIELDGENRNSSDDIQEYLK